MPNQPKKNQCGLSQTEPHQVIEDAAADLHSMSQGLLLLLQLLLNSAGMLGIDRFSALALHGLLQPYGQTLGSHAQALEKVAAQLHQS